MDIQEILKQEDTSVIISELCSKRHLMLPDIGKSEKELDVHHHKVMDRIHRPDRPVKIDTENDEFSDSVTKGMKNPEGNIRYEKVSRISLAIQKLIVKRAVSFLFGNPVDLDCSPQNENETSVLNALKRIQHDCKEKSFNRKIARHIMSYTEVAEVWYPVLNKNETYGFPSKYKLRCSVFSPFHGDMLYPYFDEYWNMLAFSRQFTIAVDAIKNKTFFETYTDYFHYMWELTSGGYTQVDGFPKKNPIGKIPVVFGHQYHTEWSDVQRLIERLETLLSNFADTNDYFASPTFFMKGELVGFAKKGETGKVIQGDTESDLKIISWDQAPESIKLEIDTLLRMIHTITQTPDISFESVKGITSISGVALELLFMDAHLKVAEHQEVFDEYLQRRINIQKAFIGAFNVKLKSAAENIMVEPIITPYMIKDKVADIKAWTEANGGNPVMSQKSSFSKAGMTSDPGADYEQYLKEESSRSSFRLSSPTFP